MPTKRVGIVSKKVIMIMVDGFGIPENGWANSIYSEFCDSRFTDRRFDFRMCVR